MSIGLFFQCLYICIGLFVRCLDMCIGLFLRSLYMILGLFCKCLYKCIGLFSTYTQPSFDMLGGPQPNGAAARHDDYDEPMQLWGQ